ncbi:hypothetical protein RSAG8_08787, partial [Rhizoctonia solani AG-8 WAC10335]
MRSGSIDNQVGLEGRTWTCRQTRSLVHWLTIPLYATIFGLSRSVISAQYLECPLSTLGWPANEDRGP